MAGISAERAAEIISAGVEGRFYDAGMICEFLCESGHEDRDLEAPDYLPLQNLTRLLRDLAEVEAYRGDRWRTTVYEALVVLAASPPEEGLGLDELANVCRSLRPSRVFRPEELDLALVGFSAVIRFEEAHATGYRMPDRLIRDFLRTNPLGGRTAAEMRPFSEPFTMPIEELTDPHAFGVRRAVEAPDLPLLPLYVEREHDRRLRERIARVAVTGESACVLVSGEGFSGKARTCWEALHAVPLEDWDFWQPESAAELLEKLPHVAPRTVIWLHDASRFFAETEDPAGRALDACGEFVTHGRHAPVLVLGTLSAAQRPPLAEADVIPIGAFDTRGRRALLEAMDHDHRLGDAFHVCEDIDDVPQALAATAAFVEAWRDAPLGTRACITAAVDARGLGHSNEFPAAFFLVAAPGYLTETELASLPDNWVGEALRHTDAMYPAPLFRGPDSASRYYSLYYRLDAHLDSVRERIRGDAEPPSSLTEAISAMTSAQAKLSVIPARTLLWRVHPLRQSGTDLASPSSQDPDRFSGGPSDPLASTSWALDRITALNHSLFSLIPDDAGHGIALADIEDHALTCVTTNADLTLVSLTDSEETRRIGADPWLIEDGPESFRLTREWAAWIHRGIPSAQGLVWRDPYGHGDSVVLFVDRCPADLFSRAGPPLSLGTRTCADLVTEILEMHYAVELPSISGDFWPRLSDEEQTQLLRMGRRISYPDGAKLYRQGEEDDRLFVLRSGTVEIGRRSDDGSETVLALRAAGDLMGEQEAAPRLTSATARGPVDALVLKRDDFTNFMGDHLRIMSILTEISSIRRSDESSPFSGQDRLIFVTDIAAFGRRDRTDADQIVLRRATYGALRDVLERAGVAWNDCHREDRGDGVLIVMPPAVSAKAVLEAVVGDLAQAVADHNRTATPGAHLGLRASLHVGPVGHDGVGAVGKSLNTACRLLDAPAFKGEFAETDADLGVIVSEEVYDEVVRVAPFESSFFHPVPVQIRETSTTGWIQLLRHPPSHDLSSRAST